MSGLFFKITFLLPDRRDGRSGSNRSETLFRLNRKCNFPSAGRSRGIFRPYVFYITFNM